MVQVQYLQNIYIYCILPFALADAARGIEKKKATHYIYKTGPQHKCTPMKSFFNTFFVCTLCALMCTAATASITFDPLTIAPVLPDPVTGANKPYSVASGDFNNDGFPDVVTGVRVGTTTPLMRSPLYVTWNNGGLWPQWLGYSTDVQEHVCTDCGDYAVGTGNFDAATPGDDIISASYFTGLWLTTWEAVDGFTTRQVSTLQGVQDIAVGDFNGDERPDFIVMKWAATVKLFINCIGEDVGGPCASAPEGRCTGNLFCEFDIAIDGDDTPWTTAGANPEFGLAVLDVDKDGHLDLAVSRQWSGVHLFRNTGDPSNWDYQLVAGNNHPHSCTGIKGCSYDFGIAAGDIDDDGNTDLVAVGGDGQYVGWLKNPGGAWPSCASMTSNYIDPPADGPTNLWDVVLADFDQNGHLDVMASGSVGLVLYLNNDSGLWSTGVVIGSASHQSRHLALLDADSDGWSDVFHAPGYAAGRAQVVLAAPCPEAEVNACTRDENGLFHDDHAECTIYAERNCFAHFC